MLRVVCCFLIGYLALATQLSGVIGPVGSAAPAVAVVIAGRLLSPSLAAAYAFLMGLGADALGSGPLGVHAALLTLCSAWQTRGWDHGRRASVWRWAFVVAITVWCDGMLPGLIDSLPHPSWGRLEPQAIQTTTSAAIAALLVALCVSLTRLGSMRNSVSGEYV